MTNKILDTYIIKKFLLAVIFAISGFLFIYIITNLFENIGYFVDRKASLLIVLQYYLLFAPKIIILLMPLATLMGIYFSLGLITKHNEVLAIRGLGISPFRIYRPIFLYGFFISLIVFSFNLSLVPKTKHLLADFKRTRIDQIKDTGKSYARNINYITENGETVIIKRLNENEIHEIHILAYEDGKIMSRIDATKGVWKNSSWTLFNVYRRDFVGDMVILETKEKELVKNLIVPPEELAKSKYNPINLPFTDLFRHIKKLDRSGQKSDEERIELLERISYPFVSFILLFFGCPLALEVKRRGLLFGFGLGTLSAFTFWGIIQLFKELGIKGNLPPSLSIVIPDILFLTIGMYFMLKKEYS